MMIMLYRLSLMLQSRRQSSLQDQHIEPVPRFGGNALFWGFMGSLLLLKWFGLTIFAGKSLDRFVSWWIAGFGARIC